MEKPVPAFVIDSSALKDIFEGKNSGGELLKKFNELSDKGIPLKAVTPMLYLKSNTCENCGCTFCKNITEWKLIYQTTIAEAGF